MASLRGRTTLKISITFNEFIFTVRFILTSTYFTFDNVIYKQTFGTPIGSLLSPIIADILQDLEEKALNALGLDLPFYFRYVDDTVLAAKTGKTYHQYFGYV